MTSDDTTIKAIQVLQQMQYAKTVHPRGWFRRYSDINRIMIQFPDGDSTSIGSGEMNIEVSEEEYQYLLSNQFIWEHPQDDTIELTKHGEELAAARIERED